MGKTTLLYQLLDMLPEQSRVAFIFQTQCNSREFFQYLLNELGVDTAGMGLVAMHKKLNEMMFDEMLEARRFVLIVDEAQNLDERVLETIRLLSNFETPHSKLLQIVLAGQPELGTKLKQKELAQLLQRISVVKHLNALSAQETVNYVRHRLGVAGYAGPELFEPSAMALIHERSHGVPRIVNKLCYNALSEAQIRRAADDFRGNCRESTRAHGFPEGHRRTSAKGGSIRNRMRIPMRSRSEQRATDR